MNPYSTHIHLLRFLMDNFDIKSVVELGIGHYSTPLFRSYLNVTVVSMDSDINWARKFESTNNKHKVGAAPLLGFADTVDWFDLVFVDGNPANERATCVQKLLTKCKILVAHDTEPPGEWKYHYGKIELPKDYVRIDDTSQTPWTSVYTADIEIIFKVKKFLNKQGVNKNES